MGDIGKYIVIGGAVLIVAVIFLVIIKTRNGFVVLQNRVKNQLAQIDVQLKRRYDLIPNLLETAKGYANFERSTLEAVVKARQSAMAAADFDQAAAANGKLQAALRRLFAVSEGRKRSGRQKQNWPPVLPVSWMYWTGNTVRSTAVT